MQKEQVTNPEMKLIGITARTNNFSEMSRTSSKISSTVKRYFQENLGEKIPNRKNPGVTIAAYTDFESDEQGEYTYFVGEEVTDFGVVPEGFTQVVVPAGAYQKFTTSPGKMPQVVINAWVEIWTMGPKDLGGKRAFKTDFEVYDQRAMDPANTAIDIYVGLA